MNQLSDMLLSMTSSVSDLGTALKAYIAKNKLQLADKNLTIKTLQDDLALLRSKQNNADQQISSAQNAEVLTLQEEIAQLKAEQDAVIKQSLSEKNEQISKLEEDIAQLKAGQDVAHEKANSEKDEQIAALNKEINALKTEQDVENERAFSDKDEQISKLQIELDEVSDMYLKTCEEKDRIQKLLYTEMNKVDQIQMELELAERERDIALRKQGINSEQKQLLAKMEHEGYKINETIERIEHISDMIKDILLEETDEENAAAVPEKRLEKA